MARKAEMAAKWLLNRLDERRWTGRLPAVRALAEAAGVSPDSLIAALRLLRDRNVVHLRPGHKGYFAGPPLEAAAPASSHELPLSGTARSGRRGAPRANGLNPRGNVAARQDEGLLDERLSSLERVERWLSSSILEGRYPANEPLPDQRGLSELLGVSHVTVRAAQRRMAAKGLLERRGRGYIPRLQSFQARRSGSSVFLADSSEFLISMSYPVFASVRAMERSLESLGWGGLQTFFPVGKPNHQPHDLIPPDHMVAGYVHFRVLTNNTWLRFFRRHPKVPVVILDHNERDAHWNREVLPKSFLLNSDNFRVGREMLRHMVELGHKDIAIFSHIQSNPEDWTGKRIWGLHPSEADAELLGIRTELKVVTLGPDGEQAKKVSRSIEELRQALEAADGIPPFEVKEKMAGAYAALRKHRLARSFEPVWEAWLKERRSTAWVCINDELAIAALNWLTARNIRVPEEVSVAGFDNTLEAYRLGITSYDFRWEALGRVAVACLSNPESLAVDAYGRVVIPGRLKERASTGPAPARP